MTFAFGDICRALRPHPVLFSPVLDTLANIVHGNDQQKQAILRHDPLSYISALLISPENPIRGSACRTVAKILFDNQHQVKAFHDNNLVPPLLQCLSDADPTVRNTAGLAMYFVTRSSTPQQTQRLVQEGCIPRLCDLLADYDTSTVCFALKSIGNVLHASGSPFHRDGAGNAGPTAALVLEAGGVAKMNRLLGHADEEIREGVTRVLTAYFCWWDEDKGNGPEDITVADTAAEASGDADGGPEPPLQRPRLS